MYTSRNDEGTPETTIRRWCGEVRTIVEPKQNIDRLWGKQRIQTDQTYRLMKYVLRVDYEGTVLLHNVVTGQLVVLDQNETEVLNRLPTAYDLSINQLVSNHFLVPEEYDEHNQVVNLRNILTRMVDAYQIKEVTSFLIFPTTSCNARCWYCFEKGLRPVTMTEETANDVIKFIEHQCGGKPVRLWWFGGEPTVAVHRIDQICQGLQERDIKFFSDMTTNGYLFDEEMIEKAKSLWNLRQASFSLDGTERTYNMVKAFSNVKDNPYQRMMRNAELLLKKGIAVVLRMNYDQDNWMEFSKLLQEAKARFPANSKLMVYPHQINMDYAEEEREAIEAWFNDKNVELSNMACDAGLFQWKKKDLPSLSYEMCGAVNGKWFVITPNGDLACCGEQLDSNQIKGNLKRGVTNIALVKEWKEFADIPRCRQCTLFPYCAKMKFCNATKRCYSKNALIIQSEEEICKRYKSLRD